MSNNWKINIYRTWEEVDDSRFIERWRTMFDAAPEAHVFMHPAMVKTWTDTYRNLQEISPLYCIAERGGNTVFMPFVVWRKNWKNAFVKGVVPAGYSDYDYHEPLVSGEVTKKFMESFWNMILGKLGNGEAGHFDFVDLPGMLIPGKDDRWTKTEICPYIDFRSYRDLDDYVSRLSKSVRNNLKRQKRKLEELGVLSYHVYEKHESEAALQDFLHVLEEHTRKWPNAYKAPGFHELLFRNAFAEGLIYYSQLRLDGRPVSWELSFFLNGRVYAYMPHYLDEYSKYSIGKVHQITLFEDCFRRGIDVYDFMRGAESYKAEWTQTDTELYRFEAQGDTLQSRLRLKANSLLSELKKKSLNFSVFAMLFGRCVQEFFNYGCMLT